MGADYVGTVTPTGSNGGSVKSQLMNEMEQLQQENADLQRRVGQLEQLAPLTNHGCGPAKAATSKLDAPAWAPAPVRPRRPPCQCRRRRLWRPTPTRRRLSKLDAPAGRQCAPRPPCRCRRHACGDRRRLREGGVARSLTLRPGPAPVRPRRPPCQCRRQRLWRPTPTREGGGLSKLDAPAWAPAPVRPRRPRASVGGGACGDRRRLRERRLADAPAWGAGASAAR